MGPVGAARIEHEGDVSLPGIGRGVWPTCSCPGGRIASTLGIGPDQFAGRPVTATSIIATPDAERLDRLAADAAAGRLRSSIRRTYRLEEVPQALADFAAGTLGKLAVTLER